MHRVIRAGAKVGKVTISNDEPKSALVVEIDFPDTSIVPSVMARVRDLFDLNSDPVLIANCLERDPGLKKLLKNHPGIRLPSGWDPFEVAIGTCSPRRPPPAISPLTDSTQETVGPPYSSPMRTARSTWSSTRLTSPHLYSQNLEGCLLNLPPSLDPCEYPPSTQPP